MRWGGPQDLHLCLLLGWRPWDACPQAPGLVWWMVVRHMGVLAHKQSCAVKAGLDGIPCCWDQLMVVGWNAPHACLRAFSILDSDQIEASEAVSTAWGIAIH